MRVVFTIQIFLLLILSAYNSKCENDQVETNGSYYMGKSDNISYYEARNMEGIAPFLLGNSYYSKAIFINQVNKANQNNEYNASGKWQLDSITYQIWDGALNDFRKKQRKNILYPTEGQNLAVRSYEWDEEKNHFLIYQHLGYFFNDEARLDSIEVWDYITINYRLFTKKSYEYLDGLLSSETTIEKFDDYGEWENIKRVEYEYDSLHRLNVIYLQEWDAYGDYWSTVEYQTYDYDSIGNLQSETTYEYDDYEDISKKINEIRYAYSDFNQPVEKTEYIKGWQEGQMVPERRQINFYDEHLNLASKNYYNWDYDLTDWLEDYRILKDYGGNADILFEENTEKWQDQWIDSLKTRYYSFDNIHVQDLKNSSFIMNYLPVVISDDIIADRIETEAWRSDQWENYQRAEFFFSLNNPVKVHEMELQDVTIYPNPVHDYLVIDTGGMNELHVIIRDMTGTKIIEQKCISGQRINTSQLKQGMYLLRIRIDGRSSSPRKFLKL